MNNHEQAFNQSWSQVAQFALKSATASQVVDCPSFAQQIKELQN